jgi:PAT family beta-lactamase induction signal transducer AmpG
MAGERRTPPIWLMGIGFAPQGAYGSVMLLVVPQLLAANHVPVPRIAAVTAIGLIPGFCSFLLAPILDWRFTRRAYAIVFTVASAACAFAALVWVRELAALTALLVIGGLAANLTVAAVGGWFGGVTKDAEQGALGAWLTVFNMVAFGLVGIVAVPLIRALPDAMGAGLISLLILIALPLYLLTPCPPADGRLARESFRDFARDVLTLLGKPSVLWTILLFVMPATAFALTNTLGGLGGDFKTSEALVSLLGGFGTMVAGVIGSLLIPPLTRRIAPRPLYLWVGGVGALFTLMLVLLPRNPASFGLAMLGENGFQSAAFAVSNFIILRTIGHGNPLAATQFGLLNATASLPLSYMQYIDGQAYGLGGVSGSYLADGLISGAACAALALMLWGLRRYIPPISATDQAPAG